MHTLLACEEAPLTPSGTVVDGVKHMSSCSVRLLPALVILEMPLLTVFVPCVFLVVLCAVGAEARPGPEGAGRGRPAGWGWQGGRLSWWRRGKRGPGSVRQPGGGCPWEGRRCSDRRPGYSDSIWSKWGVLVVGVQYALGGFFGRWVNVLAPGTYAVHGRGALGAPWGPFGACTCSMSACPFQ